MHYDPMIAKLIVWDDGDADPRRGARARMLQALAQYRIVGVANNVDFLSRLVACPAFAQADLDTGLIAREHEFLFPAEDAAPREAWLLAGLGELLREKSAAVGIAATDANPHSPWHLRDGWRANSTAQRTLKFRTSADERSIGVAYAGERFLMELDGSVTAVSGESRQDGTLYAYFDGRRVNAAVVVSGEKRHVFFDGRACEFVAVDPLFHAADAGGAEGHLTAPMPGKVIALLVGEGDSVEKGAPLMILEAMKMEHTIVAPAAGVVSRFHFGVGDQVGDGAELVEFAK